MQTHCFKHICSKQYVDVYLQFVMETQSRFTDPTVCQNLFMLSPKLAFIRDRYTVNLLGPFGKSLDNKKFEV